jgi:hypothetical protein
MKKLLKSIAEFGYKFEFSFSGEFYHIMIAKLDDFKIDDDMPVQVLSWTGTDMKEVVKNAYDYVGAVELG